MADDSKAGAFAGVTYGSPFGIGGGAYVDSHGALYPQIYVGTPKWGASAGVSNDPESILTGFSISGTADFGKKVGPNLGYTPSTQPSAYSVGIGTKGIGMTYGFKIDIPGWIKKGTKNLDWSSTNPNYVPMGVAPSMSNPGDPFAAGFGR